jgi:hypothetical protein
MAEVTEPRYLQCRRKSMTTLQRPHAFAADKEVVAQDRESLAPGVDIGGDDPMTQGDFLQSLESTLQLRGVPFNRAELQSFVESSWLLIQENPDVMFWSRKIVEARLGDKLMPTRTEHSNQITGNSLVRRRRLRELRNRRSDDLLRWSMLWGLFAFLVLLFLLFAFTAPIPVLSSKTLVAYNGIGPDPNSYITFYHCGVGWPWAVLKHTTNEARGTNTWEWTDIRQERLWSRVAVWVMLAALFYFWHPFTQHPVEVENSQGTEEP